MTTPRELARRRAQAERAGRGGLDLSAVKDEAKIRVEAEKRLGYRCGGCGERVTVGLRFMRLDVGPSPPGETRPQVDHTQIVACNGANGCDFAGQVREGADMVEMIEFVWLTGEPGAGAGSLEDDVAAAAARVAGSGDAEADPAE